MTFLANLFQGDIWARLISQRRANCVLEPRKWTLTVVIPGLCRYSDPPRVAKSYHPRRYVVYRSVHRGNSYNLAWQAAPRDTQCRPSNMLDCPLERRFCGH